jgi:hypothetical protein
VRNVIHQGRRNVLICDDGSSARPCRTAAPVITDAAERIEPLGQLFADNPSSTALATACIDVRRSIAVRWIQRNASGSVIF